MSISHPEMVEDCAKWEENSTLTVSGVANGQVVVDSHLGDVRAYRYNGGMIAVAHSHMLATTDTIISDRGYLVKSHHSESQDFMIFGEKLKVAMATKRMTMSIKGVNYTLHLNSINKNKIYATCFFKPPFGASGTPIYNDQGQFVSIFSSSLTQAFTYEDGNQLREWIEEQILVDILAGRSQCLQDRIMAEEKNVEKRSIKPKYKEEARGPSEANDSKRKFYTILYRHSCVV